MGTRGLLGHIIRGRKKGSYNHFDSYPDGLGVDLARFIKALTEEQIEEKIKNLEQLEWVNDEDPVPEHLQDRYTSFHFENLRVNTQSPGNWYCLLNNVQGAKCLPHILEGTLTHQIDGTSFEDDRLFCEWVYWIDWENRKVQVRSGEFHEINEKCSFSELNEEWMKRLGRKARYEDEGVEEQQMGSLGIILIWTELRISSALHV